jgi:PKD repeat protein
MILLNDVTLFAGEVTLSWDPPVSNEDGSPLIGLDGYIVYFDVASGGYSQSIDVGNITTYKIDNLIDGLTYYFVVTVYNISGNESGYSNQVSKYISSIDTTVPVISGVYADNITSNSVTINWTTNEAADTQVEYGTTYSFGNTTNLDSSLLTIHSQTINVAPSTQYYYQVISSDVSGNLAVSDNHTFTSAELQDLIPPVISNIQITDITPFSATIKWMTNEASTSQVEYGLNSYYGDLAFDTELVTIHSIDITGLSSYTAYGFRVISMDSAYNETLSEDFSFTTSNLPPEITNYYVNPVSGFTALAVNFTSSALDSDGYIVKHEWDYDGDGNYDKDTGAVTSSSFIYTNAGTYNARLKITDNGGSSAISNVVTVTVDAPINQPPIVLSLNANPSTGTAPLTVTLSAAASDPDGTLTRYEWDFDGNGAYDVETTSIPATYIYNSPGNYAVKVRVTDNDGGTAIGETIVRVRNGKGHYSDHGNKKGKKR